MERPIQLLVVDDDPQICQYLERLCVPPLCETISVKNKSELFKTLKSKYIDVILQDLFLGKENGIELLKEIKKSQPGTEVIMMTGNSSLETAVEAMRLGAYDYIAKPFDSDELLARIQRAYDKSLLSSENILLRQEIQHDSPLSEIIGGSTEIKDLLKIVKKVAPSEASVLIQGESGTGKEVLARALHNLSPRKEKPFVALNCSNLEKQLLESELFGYVPGAFTGATQIKPGLLECASEGTLFIDEIGDMDLSVQPKLLRILETQEFRRLGDNRPIKVNLRIIAASHKDLKDQIKKGLFREDLFYRLNVVDLTVPPLRKRKEDIPLLIHYFLKQSLSSEVKGIDTQAIKTLIQYDFPGNIRELKNIIERASILTSSSTITVEDLPHDIQDRIKGKTTQKQNLESYVAREEKNFIQQVLTECHGNKTLTAKALGISRRNLYRKLELYHI